jgi:3-oxoacyl-[acyl-carrier-protein] synthase II
MAGQLTDTKGRPVVVVTGMGVVTSLGQGKEANWAALTAGRSGIKRITRFPTEGLRTTIAGTVDDIDVGAYSAYELSYAMAERATDEALAQSAIGGTGRFPGPLFIATPPSELEWPALRQLHEDATVDAAAFGYARLRRAARTGRYQQLARHVEFASIADRMQARFGTRGAPVSICTACASGATTIQMGLEAIRRGETEAALCVGADATVHPEGLIRFSLLSALSTDSEFPERASKPFSRSRDGFVIAEGAAALVLESYDAARSRGAAILGVVRGAGEKADHYHRTRSKPDGSAIIGAIRKTLADADAGRDEVACINAHGTSTPENDKMEYLSLRAVLGDHLDATPVSSNKSIVGHTLIAAGSVEAVFSLMTIGAGVIPPTINYDEPDPEIPLDVVANVARPANVKAVLSNSFGFGGQNVCLFLAGEPK